MRPHVYAGRVDGRKRGTFLKFKKLRDICWKRVTADRKRDNGYDRTCDEHHGQKRVSDVVSRSVDAEE